MHPYFRKTLIGYNEKKVILWWKHCCIYHTIRQKKTKKRKEETGAESSVNSYNISSMSFEKTIFNHVFSIPSDGKERCSKRTEDNSDSPDRKTSRLLILCSHWMKNKGKETSKKQPGKHLDRCLFTSVNCKSMMQKIEAFQGPGFYCRTCLKCF